MLRRLPSGDRARAGRGWSVARVWPRAFRAHARASDRATSRRDDDRGEDLLRSGALSRRTILVLETTGTKRWRFSFWFMGHSSVPGVGPSSPPNLPRAGIGR